MNVANAFHRSMQDCNQETLGKAIYEALNIDASDEEHFDAGELFYSEIAFLMSLAASEAVACGSDEKFVNFAQKFRCGPDALARFYTDDATRNLAIELMEEEVAV